MIDKITFIYSLIQYILSFFIFYFLEPNFILTIKKGFFYSLFFFSILFFLNHFQLCYLNYFNILIIISNILFLTSVFTDLIDFSVYVIISYIFIGCNILFAFFNDSFYHFGLKFLYSLLLYLFFYGINYLGKKIYKKEEVLGQGDLDILYGLIFQLSLIKTVYIFVGSSYLISFYALILKFIFKKSIREIYVPLVPFLFISYALHYIFY